MTPTPINDPVLGLLTWDECDTWHFTAGEISGRPLHGLIIADEHPVLDKRRLEIIRAQVKYVHANEFALRDHVAREMFDWWVQSYYDEDEDDVHDSDGFRDAIHLSGFNFYESGLVRVWYNDAGLIGNHGIWIELNPDGTIADGPDFA